MKRRFLARRPRPAMLVAVVALVLSLTGGAIAASLITTGDIKNGAVTKKKLHKNSVNTKKVKNKTLKAKDFAPGQLEQGVQGIQGLKGEKGDKGEPGADGADGAAGATNVVIRTASVNVNNNTRGFAVATCEAGEKAVGGGGRFTELSATNVHQLVYSYPKNTATNNLDLPAAGDVPNAWQASGFNTSGGPETFNAFVVCAAP
jgi:hypothetical protein